MGRGRACSRNGLFPIFEIRSPAMLGHSERKKERRRKKEKKKKGRKKDSK